MITIKAELYKQIPVEEIHINLRENIHTFLKAYVILRKTNAKKPYFCLSALDLDVLMVEFPNDFFCEANIKLNYYNYSPQFNFINLLASSLIHNTNFQTNYRIAL
jgi:hypothetical protein